eukprot:scaffold2564_cov65-Phaeocystis_antarctica.AAC.5
MSPRERHRQGTVSFRVRVSRLHDSLLRAPPPCPRQPPPAAICLCRAVCRTRIGPRTRSWLHDACPSRAACRSPTLPRRKLSSRRRSRIRRAPSTHPLALCSRAGRPSCRRNFQRWHARLHPSTGKLSS